MLNNKKTEETVALKGLEMKKDGFSITLLREINTVLKVQHENVATLRGYHSVEDFNYFNPVHDHIEWCIMLKDKTEEIVALKGLEMNKEEGFPITSLGEINTVLKVQHEKIVTVRGYHSVEDFNYFNPVHDHIEWCIMLKDKKTEEIVTLKRLKMEKEGFPITSLREINTALKGQHENVATLKGYHSVEDFNSLNPVHDHIEWCIMLKDKKTEEIVTLKRLKMEKEGFPITSLREINTALKGQHENVATLKGYHSVEDFNSLNPVHDHIEWCIMLNVKKIVALKGLKMRKEDGFLITSLREINTVLRGQHKNIVTVKGYHSVEDINSLNPVHDHIEWCIMLKDKKTEEIVTLKGLKMEKEEGFLITSLREINTVLRGQRENIVTVKGYHSVEDFNCLYPVHDHIEWCIMLNVKKIVALKGLKMRKEDGFLITSLREINTVLRGQRENIVTVKGYHSVKDFNYFNPVYDHIEWCIVRKDKKTEEIGTLKRLKMEKEGFPITSLREINTALKGQHENVATLKGYHSVEDFNSLNQWCIMLKDKKEEIVALKRLKMKKEEGFLITSLREINTVLQGQHENIVTVRVSYRG